MPDVICNHCQSTFTSYKELALHIMKYKSHRKGRVWASQYLAGKKDAKKQYSGRVALSEEEKENRLNSQRQLSGINKVVETYCPRCKRKQIKAIPEEYVESHDAWRLAGTLVNICGGCS